MERVQKIIAHPTVVSCMEQLEEFEKERIFCRHDVSHLLDVARVAYILNLEAQWEIPKEWIYATALLHDVGRAEQYQCGTPHQEAGARIARRVLADCQFAEEEQQMIVSAILEHRSGSETGSRLAEVIRRADKISRPCFQCAAEVQCNWSREKKNFVITY